MFERNLPGKLSEPSLRHPVFPAATDLLLFSMPLAYFSIYFPIKSSMLFIKILKFFYGRLCLYNSLKRPASYSSEIINHIS